MMTLIVAVDAGWGIGYRGRLLAHVKEDMRHFRTLSTGKTVIYGSNTLATFPDGKPLINRKNIILHPDADFKVEGAIVAHSLEELFVYTETHPEEEFVVIGGASVYRQLLPYCTVAYVTKFSQSFEKDVYFENLDERPEWRLTEEGALQNSVNSKTGEAIGFRFCIYRHTEG